MNKKSKITVKHYLEKKVKPTVVYDDIELGFPLYYRITYKRKTTNLKSFTGAIMTEKAYEYFKKTNKVDDFETNYKGSYINLRIENELLFLEKALEEITRNNENISAFDEHFIENLKTFFNDLEESLYFQGWHKHIQELDLKEKPINKEPLTVKQILNKKTDDYDDDTNYHLKGEFYHIFNKDKSLIYCLNTLKETTGFDAFPYIHANTIKFWHVIGLILKVYPNTLFIDFFINFDLQKIIKMNSNNKNVTNNEIELICNKLKNNHLGIYFK
jgi:hypothetical protein